MTKNTLTTIDKIHPGSMFCFPDNQDKIFIKLSELLIKKNRHVYHCQARTIDNLIQRNFQNKEQIIFLNKPK